MGSKGNVRLAVTALVAGLVFLAPAAGAVAPTKAQSFPQVAAVHLQRRKKSEKEPAAE